MEEAAWAIEVMKELGVPVACTMRVGPTGDFDDIPPGECAARMATAGQICIPVYLPSYKLPVYQILSKAKLMVIWLFIF